MGKKICLFWGEEDFLIEEEINHLKEKFSGTFEILDGSKATLEELTFALQTMSMFGEQKMIVVRGPVDQEIFLPLVENLSPTVLLVLTAPSIDRRSKLYKFVEKHGEVKEFKPFAPWETPALISWIETRARISGRKITRGAAYKLQEIYGNNLRLIASEIEKIITYLGEREIIGEEEVEILASPLERTVFDFIDALAEKDLKKALAYFQFLLKGKEDFFRLLAAAVGRYRTMLQLKSLSGQVHDHRQMAQMLGANPYYIKKCLENVNRFTENELKYNLKQLLAAGLKLKTGESPETTFEVLLTSLSGVI